MRECNCCHKPFSQEYNSERIFCIPCSKKIKKEVHRLRRKEHPFAFWKWNTTCVNEVDEIVEKIQNELIKEYN